MTSITQYVGKKMLNYN